jgi:hypothetical protein
MTIVIGVICKEGVVIGSDSSATFLAGNLNIHTVEQKIKKVTVIHDNKVMCGSGEVALSQRFEQIISRYWLNSDLTNKSDIDITVDLYQSTLKDFQLTNSNFNQFCSCLAFFHNDSFSLCEFPLKTFLPELKSESLWYVSMGSGQIITDPFLGFVRKIFWNDKQPCLNDGIFGTIWALNHAIEVNPGGIGAPVQIGILDNNTKSARLLSDSELEEHIECVSDFENHIRRYRREIFSTPTKEIPKVT